MITRSPNTPHGRGSPVSTGELPSWVPAVSNTFGTIPEVNTYASIYPGTSPPNGYSYIANGSALGGAMWNKSINDYSGGVYNPYYSPSGGSRGSLIFHGGGHAANNWNGITAFDLTSLTYHIVMGGTLNAYPLGTNGEYADGQPASAHTYDYPAILGPEAGYPKGALLLPMVTYGAYEGSTGGYAVHLFDFANPQLQFVRLADHDPKLPNGLGGGNSCYDPDKGRVWWATNVYPSGGQAYFDLATNKHVMITTAGLPPRTGQSMRYDIERKLILLPYLNTAYTERRLLYFQPDNPSAGWVRATLSSPLEIAGGFSFDKVQDGSYLCISRTSPQRLVRLQVPTVLTDPWLVSDVAYTGIQPPLSPEVSMLGKRWSYVPSLQSIVCKYSGYEAPTILRV